MGLYLSGATLTMAAVTMATWAAQAQPIRSDDHWAIYAQDNHQTDWDALLTGENLALGAAVRLEPEPTYAPTRDDADREQLTDGSLSTITTGHIWHDRTVVGWAYQESARVTVDLAEPRPVGQVLLRVQTSINGEDTTPRDVQLALSEDGRNFTRVRTLTKKTHPDDNPALTFEPLPPTEGAVHAFVLDAGYRARYVRLDFALSGHLVMDEIAVLGAEGEVAQLPPQPETEPEYRDNVFDRRQQFREMIAPGNLAEGLELSYAPRPGYRLTTNETDALDLTDGQFGQRSDERIWFEPVAVAWQHSPTVTIFADLGAEQPIDAVVIRLLGGGEQGGLVFPDTIRVLLSPDGDAYYQVAERHKRGLDDLSPTAWDLPEEAIAWVHNFRLPVGLRARYLAVQLEAQKQFICSDELAVVRGADDLPAFAPDERQRVTIVTEGVAFSPLHAVDAICHNRFIRLKVATTDARAGDEYGRPCTLLLDLPDSVELAGREVANSTVQHEGREFTRYELPATRGRPVEVYLRTSLPVGERDVLYMYGDAGDGPQNERRVTWESIEIPTARPAPRLDISLAWMGISNWYDGWPDGITNMREMGFNALGTFPRYWDEANLAHYQEALAAARAQGMKIIINESPAGAEAGDRGNDEIRSVLADGPGRGVCPSYRGQYYQKEHQGFARHAAWIRPDFVFYDIEAYYNGSQEAPRCQRCQQRFEEGGFTGDRQRSPWDEFRAAMGREIHEDMKRDIEAALGGDTGIIYGSYRTMPTTPLNDGLFAWDTLYPDLLQLAMPSLYVAGDQMRVASVIAAQRAALPRNDIVPWLSTGTYGEYEPVRTRDMILEAFANGARGVTYYYYANFDPWHFKYHAEAIDIVAPVQDIFADGQPIVGLTCSDERIKVCGMALNGELAILVSNYQGVPAGTEVTITAPIAQESGVFDLHAGERIGTVRPGEPLTVTIDEIGAHLYYVGNAYAGAVPR